MTRWNNSTHPVRKVPFADIYEAFLLEEKRSVSKTRIISIYGNEYEVEPFLCGKDIIVRYHPHDLTYGIRVFFEDKQFKDAIPSKVHRHARKGYEQNESKLKKQFKDNVYVLYKTQNKSLVIVIDNAQALPESTVKEIRFLISFEFDSFSPLSIILAGHSDLWDTLKLQSFELVFQCISNHYRIMPLDEKQTGEYIAHQIKLSDCSMLFPEDITKQIYSFTRGIPRIINRVCSDCLLDMEQHDLELVDSTVLERVINELSF